MHEDVIHQLRMPLLSTEDQALIAENAAQVVRAEAPVSRFRSFRDAGQTFDAELWQKLTELGWPGMSFSADDGGLGLTLAETSLLCEALGSTLAMTPIISTILAGPLDPEAGAAAGNVVALAWWEAGCKGDLHHVKASVQNGRLTGRKEHVLDAMAAQSFVVTAWEGETLGLWAVDAAGADPAHVQRVALSRVDSRDAGHVVFTDAPARRLSATLADLEASMDAATAALSAEMLGGMQAAFDLTLAYLKERVQFDVPIGSFQALQHRAVDCFIAIEVCRSAVAAAVRQPSPALVSLAKTLANDAYLKVCNEAVQFFGGIGMTDEHDIGLYLKRAWASSQILGSSAFHRDRWARLRAY